MARIRTIKPEFFTSLTISELSPYARLTFIGLWTQVDDEGRCVDDARIVKGALWSLDDRTTADVEQDLKELAKLGLVLRYSAAGRSYLAVANWKEHQRINRPSPSKLPAPPDRPNPPTSRLTDGSVNPHAEDSVNGRYDGPRSVDALIAQIDQKTDDRRSFSGLRRPVSSENRSLTEHSVSAHGTLTEDSLGERKGKERKGTPPTPHTEPAPTDARSPEEGEGEGNGEDREERLIATIRRLRPEWSTNSIRRAIRHEDVRDRPWPIITAAFTALARDPETKAPGRLAADGPWWAAAANGTRTPKLPPPCGECGPNRQIQLPDGSVKRCPTCHPINVLRRSA